MNPPDPETPNGPNGRGVPPHPHSAVPRHDPWLPPGSKASTQPAVWNSPSGLKSPARRGSLATFASSPQPTQPSGSTHRPGVPPRPHSAVPRHDPWLPPGSKASTQPAVWNSPSGLKSPARRGSLATFPSSPQPTQPSGSIHRPGVPPSENRTLLELLSSHKRDQDHYHSQLQKQNADLKSLGQQLNEAQLQHSNDLVALQKLKETSKNAAEAVGTMHRRHVEELELRHEAAKAMLEQRSNKAQDCHHQDKSAWRAELSKLHQEKQDTQKAMDKLKSTHDRYVAALEQRNKTNQDRIRDENKSTEDHLSRLLSQSQQARKSEVTALKERNKALDARLCALHEEQQAKDQTIAELLAKHVAEKDALAKEKKELKSRGSTSQHKEDELVNIRAQNAKLQQEMTCLQIAHEKLQAQKAAWEQANQEELARRSVVPLQDVTADQCIHLPGDKAGPEDHNQGALDLNANSTQANKDNMASVSNSAISVHHDIRLQESEREREDLARKLQTAKDQRATLLEEKNTLMQQCKTAEQHSTALLKERDEFARECQTAIDKMASISTSNISPHHENLIQDLQSKAEISLQQRQAAEKHGAILEGEKSDLTQKLEDAEKHGAILEGEKSDLTQKLEDAEKHGAALACEKSDLTQKLEDAEKHGAALACEKSDLMQKLELAEQHGAALEDEKSDLGQKLKGAEQHSATLEKKRGDLQEKLRGVEGLLQLANSEATSYSDQIVSLNEQQRQTERLLGEVRERWLVHRGVVRILCRVRTPHGPAENHIKYTKSRVQSGAACLVIERDNPTQPKATRSFEVDAIVDSENAEDLATELQPFILSAKDGAPIVIILFGRTATGKSRTAGQIWEQVGKLIFPEETEDAAEEPQDEKAIDQAEEPSPYLSCTEAYGVGLYDLLGEQVKPSKREPKQNPQLTSVNRESRAQSHPGHPVTDYGAKTIGVRTRSELSATLQAANARRNTAATNLNTGSSRSHAFSYLKLHSGSICVIDLAGQEKQHMSGAPTAEVTAINEELSALTSALSALYNNTHSGKDKKRDVAFIWGKKLMPRIVGGLVLGAAEKNEQGKSTGRPKLKVMCIGTIDLSTIDAAKASETTLESLPTMKTVKGAHGAL